MYSPAMQEFNALSVKNNQNKSFMGSDQNKTINQSEIRSKSSLREDVNPRFYTTKTDAFKERFKGRTQMIDKEGHAGIVEKHLSGIPIHKIAQQSIGDQINLRKSFDNELVSKKRRVFSDDQYDMDNQNFFGSNLNSGNKVVYGNLDRILHIPESKDISQSNQKALNKITNDNQGSDIQASFFQNFQIYKSNIYVPGQLPGLDSIQNAPRNRSNSRNRQVGKYTTEMALKSTDKQEENGIQNTSNQNQRLRNIIRQTVDFNNFQKAKENSGLYQDEFQTQSFQQNIGNTTQDNQLMRQTKDLFTKHYKSHETSQNNISLPNINFRKKIEEIRLKQEQQEQLVIEKQLQAELKAKKNKRKQKFLKRVDLSTINSKQANSQSSNQNHHQNFNGVYNAYQETQSKPVSSQHLGDSVNNKVSKLITKYASQKAIKRYDQISDQASINHHQTEETTASRGTARNTNPLDSQMTNRKANQSQIPSRGHQNENKPVKFREFTQERPGKYYKLGGLGPSNIGTEEWLKGKQKREFIKEYTEGLRASRQGVTNITGSAEGIGSSDLLKSSRNSHLRENNTNNLLISKTTPHIQSYGNNNKLIGNKFETNKQYLLENLKQDIRLNSKSSLDQYNYNHLRKTMDYQAIQ
eukprot:403345156